MPVATSSRSKRRIEEVESPASDEIVVNIPLPRTPTKAAAAPKRSRDAFQFSPNPTTPTPKKTRTPSKKPLLIHNDSPTKRRGSGASSSKLEVATPPRATLGSSAKKALPTPSSRSGSIKKSGLVEKQVYDVPSPLAKAAISREAFLANEALKRQREARNFKYKGDANAPRLTRSGRVVGETTFHETDMYGEEVVDEEASDVDGLDAAEEIEPAVEEEAPPEPMEKSALETRSAPPQHDPLPDMARQHIASILATLTSQRIASSPPPFHEESQNETLMGLLKLLQGTVDRGEGNSALIAGPRGVGKTQTVARALTLLTTEKSKTSPIVVNLSGHVQTNDRLAIREMGRQIATAEGKQVEEEPDEDPSGELESEEYAPTTLPSHLLALLTAPSPRAIIIVIEEFDLFTEHARQALLYCLLDVVQSIKTGPVETTGRGVAVIGVTSRIDTLLLLEKRVKSRFSHRMWRVTSPVAPGAMGWSDLLTRALIPWRGHNHKPTKDNKEMRKWKGDWEFAIDSVLCHKSVVDAFDRLCGLTIDVRNVFKPFVLPLSEILSGEIDFMSAPELAEQVLVQVELAGWGSSSQKLKGLPHPALAILIIAKHLYYAGREELNFAQVEEEYLRFSRTKLVGSGKTRWPLNLLRTGFDHLIRVSLLVSTSNSSVAPRFAKYRCVLSPHGVVAWFKGDGANVLGPELTSWGRLMGGHA